MVLLIDSGSSEICGEDHFFSFNQNSHISIFTNLSTCHLHLRKDRVYRQIYPTNTLTASVRPIDRKEAAIRSY